jgi:hypothetical protein
MGEPILGFFCRLHTPHGAPTHGRITAMRIVTTPLLFWADGMTVTPRLVVVHPRGRRDVGLLAHEAVHCRQMREVGMLRFWWRYFTCPAFRLWAEVEAYRVSLRHQPSGLRHFARALARGYLLDIDEQEAERLIRG